MRRARFIVVVLATTIVLHGGRAVANQRAALRCRDVIAANFRVVVREGLRALDACHAKRDAGQLHADCNQLFSLSPPPRAFASLLTSFGIETARAAGIIRANCSAGGLLTNYPNTTSAADIPNVVGMAIRKEIELSGATVQGAPDLAGQAKAHRRCHAAIGRARTAIVLDTIHGAVRCERALDPSVGELGAISADCLGRTARVTSRARTRVARACAGIAGPEVGSCGPLPDCVVTEAVRTGETMARDFYGATPAQRQTLCGNGFLDLGEECDDGNTDPTDACTDTCQIAKCGDGIVEVGVEQCDDGNRVNDDACSNKCTRTSCGDGIVQAGEECDDGNTIPNDGCTDCILDPVPCNADGFDARVCLAKTQETAQQIQGVTVEVAYPAPLSIPGSGLASTVRQRVMDLTGGVGLSAVADRDENMDGVDETLRNAYATTAPKTVPFGPFELIHFDCPAGTLVRAHDLPCTISDASDSLGGKIDPMGIPLCLVGVAPHGGTPNVDCPSP
jgi:cysteine-rich repeat protein